MDRKKCNFCGLTKPLYEFGFLKKENRYLTRCKECRNKYERQYRAERREKFRKINKTQYDKNRKNRIQQAKKYRIEHKDSVNKTRMDNYNKRMKTDNLFRCKTRVRQVIIQSFKRKSMRKNKNTLEIIGCDAKFIQEYLLNTYEKKYGEKYDGKEPVHIDHIIPLATANTEEEIIKLCHYTNLQLLKAEDNLKKGSKYNDNNMTRTRQK